MAEQASTPRFRGESIELGGVTYVVPPLSLRQVQDLLPKIETIGKKGADGSASLDFSDMLAVITSAINRNYPDVTAEQLVDVIDLGNVVQLFRSVMARSGFTKPEGGSGNSAPGPASP